MAIPLVGQFFYQTTLERIGGKTWGGRALPRVDRSKHPGLAGDAPGVRLADGAIELTCTDRDLSEVADTHWRTTEPARRVSFPVGSALDAVAADGDVLRVYRGATTDLAATIVRDSRLVIALGAIARHEFHEGIVIEEDPRADEMKLYPLRPLLDDPATTLVWLDANDPRVHEELEARLDTPTPGRILAIAGLDEEQRRRLNMRLPELTFPSRHTSTDFVQIGARFSSVEQWVAYIRGLPATRPNDLHIRFTVNGADVIVREGDDAFHAPWHLVVTKVRTWGIPGEGSKLAIARAHDALTREMLIESAALIANRRSIVIGQ